MTETAGDNLHAVPRPGELIFAFLHFLLNGFAVWVLWRHFLYVVPMIDEIFSGIGAELPQGAGWQVAVSDILRHYIILIVPVAVMPIFCAVVYFLQHRRGRAKLTSSVLLLCDTVLIGLGLCFYMQQLAWLRELHRLIPAN
ncbi:hypothetical protein JXA32_13435 [Candidatus Sumerlaeota bacterium]|nr:hypothetical protein [Candidatus Sumerlaeota bacterium]